MKTSFKQMWDSYPLGSAQDVKKEIGGRVNYGWIENTCAIRFSKVLNGTEHKLSSGFSGMNVISGAMGNKYAYRVKELRRYIIAKFGTPDIIETGTSGVSEVNFKGKRGIIIFHVSEWNNATGHITLWDGIKCVNQDKYFNKSSKVELWKLY